MLKKITLPVLGLAISGFASAGSMSSCVPGYLTVPCETKQWNLGVQALYLRPVYTASKGYEYNTVGQLKAAEPEWGWGYRLEGSYHSYTGYDVTMTLVHFDKDSTRRDFVGVTPYALTRVPFNVWLDNKLDQVNLVLGQEVDMSVWKKARFYGGLQYANFRLDSANYYTATPLALVLGGANNFRQSRNADYNGVGPVLGVNYAYAVAQGLSVTANSALSILYGTGRYSEGYILGSAGLISFSNGHSQRMIVPGMDAKLGLNYSYELAQGKLDIEGGYQAINYFNGLETRGVVGISRNPNNTNVALYGPYFGLKWVGNL